MKIPRLKKDRENLYVDLASRCMASQTDRISRYSLYRNWYIFGNAEGAQPSEYNKLFSHIDLYSSYLFSGETTNFVIEVPDIAAHDIDYQTKISLKLAPQVNNVWHDSNTDIIFNEALNWALVFDTTFVKLVPLRGKEFASYIVMPEKIGVLREDVPTLWQQEAVCHEYFITASEIERRIESFSETEKAKVRRLLKPQQDAKDEKSLPPAVSALVMHATAPELKGKVDTRQLISFNFSPRIMEDGLTAYELWVYDDDKQDYRTITILEGDYVLYDADKNTFVPNQLPFIKITPNWMANYFWGRSELMYLTPLQEWINVRIPEIKEILSKLASPPKALFGSTIETKLSALMHAAGVASFDEPGAKVEEYYPKEVSDLFRELKVIEDFFNEISGIREIMKGGGESGVRAGAHADLLARLGSSRAKKKAFILEDAIEHCATLILAYLRKYDPTHYKVELGEKSISVVANHLTPTAAVKVDAHSSSPIFLEQQMDKAKMLFEAGAIDKEDLIDAVRYHNAAHIKKKLKEREAAAAAAAQAEAQAKQTPQLGGQ